jgi:hypothetical protein
MKMLRDLRRTQILLPVMGGYVIQHSPDHPAVPGQGFLPLLDASQDLPRKIPDLLQAVHPQDMGLKLLLPAQLGQTVTDLRILAQHRREQGYHQGIHLFLLIIFPGCQIPEQTLEPLRHLLGSLGQNT